MRRLMRMAVALTIVTLMLHAADNSISIAGQDKTLQVWVISEMERVDKSTPPGTARDIELFAARGEYEPFQVVVRAPNGGLTNVDLVVSDLADLEGRRIRSQSVALYREHFIEVTASTPTYGRKDATVGPLGPGWYPDALIPFLDRTTGGPPKPAKYRARLGRLASGENQPYWVDLFVPRDTKPGWYEGTFTVTSDQGRLSGHVRLNVWNFELPLRPSEGSAFPLAKDQSVAACEELLLHRLMPTYTPPGAAARLIKEYGLTMTAANFWSGAYVSDHKMKPAPSIAEFAARRKEYPQELRLYNWTADEIFNAPELIRPLQEWARNMHKAGIDSMLVAPPTPELFDDGTGTGRTAVDIWPIQCVYYNMSPRNVEGAMKKGMEIWTYTALNQEGHAPKWLIDFAPVNYRVLPGFLNQSMGFTGILYWCVDHWQAGADPWLGAPYHHEGSAIFPGEGVLVYPGRDAGVPVVVPSMRLKWVRDGMEDYEYVELLKKSGRAKEALEISRSVARDFKTWSQRPAVYEEAHRRIGKALSLEASPLGSPRHTGAERHG